MQGLPPLIVAFFTFVVVACVLFFIIYCDLQLNA